MNINNNLFQSKFATNLIGLKNHSLISDKLKNVLKNSNIVSSDNTADKLNLSKQAEMLITHNAADAENIKLDNMLEKVGFTNLVGNLVNATLDEAKTEIEDSMKAYSSYTNKINDGTLDKNVSFDEYADDEIKKKYKSDSMNVINTLVNETDASNNAQKNKPIENTENIGARKGQAFEQLQNRIKKIIDNSINSLNKIFTGISVSSPELTDNINEIKQNVTSLISSIKDINLDNTKSESEFANSLKKLFKNINKTQNNIRTFLYKQSRDILGLDKDYLNKITYKFENETANNVKRFEYDNDLIDSTFGH